MRVLVSLLAARARRAGMRRLAVAAALGLGTALAVVSAAVTAVTAEGALDAAVAGLPPGERSVTVATFGLPPPARSPSSTPWYGASCHGSAPARCAGELLYRELGDTHRNTVVLGGVDDLGAAVRLVSGRLPASCTPARCEVVLALPPDAPVTTRAPELDGSLGVAVVGAVRLTDPLLLAGTFTPASGAPLLLGDGIERVGAISALGTFGRTIGWVTPLDLARVRSLGVDAWVDAATATADDFARTTNDALTVTAPGDVLRAEHDRAVTNAQRFTLLGATGSVLLLGAAVVGGAALRRDHEAFSGALRRRGAAPRLLAGAARRRGRRRRRRGTGRGPRARRGRGRRRRRPRRALRAGHRGVRRARRAPGVRRPQRGGGAAARAHHRPAGRAGRRRRPRGVARRRGRRPGLRRGRRGPHRPRRCRRQRHRHRDPCCSPCPCSCSPPARWRSPGCGCRPCGAASGSCPARPSPPGSGSPPSPGARCGPRPRPRCSPQPSPPRSSPVPTGRRWTAAPSTRPPTPFRSTPG